MPDRGATGLERAAPARLVRDRLTLALYGYSVMWGWYLYSFTPAIPLIAADLGISRAEAGLHGTFMAVGTVLAGMMSARLAHRLGRRAVLLISPGIVIVGVALLTTGHTLAQTLPAAAITALGGSLCISGFQPALSVHQGPAGASALTEANGTGALVGLLAPLALGLSVALGVGWRPSVALTAVLAIVVGGAMSRFAATGALGRPGHAVDAGPQADGEPEPGIEVAHLPAQPRQRGFSPAFWLFWAALVCVIGVENATTFWASDLLREQTGASAGLASGAVSGLIAGMAASRFAVGRLALRFSTVSLLLASFVVAGAGWLLFWTATSPAVGLAGLILAGLGYGAHYPLMIASTMAASEGRPDMAQSRSTVAAGAAIAVAPLLLGALADQVGPHLAFMLVPVLLTVAAGAVILARRSARRTAGIALL
ncbi:MFS transporter [Cellulomonas timonensis]|uniref:MFS transporter n=1 Tax=Cellulomonas timonensis TaxID=1689271 RepID=UPI0008370FB5|nr:MFS transporter [Cellulomonas timonensis]